MTFYDGGISIGTGTISGNSASFTSNALGVGTHTITASWPGDTDYNAVSSGSLSQVVAKATPTITVSTSGTPAKTGASVTFTATLSSGPSGTVNFFDGTNEIGSGTISGTTSTYTTSSLSVGVHDISASWAGDADYNSLSSGSIVQAVGPILYSYTVPAGGYDGTGNLLTYSDSVMGVWNLSYDTLNRLTGATDTQPNNPDTNYCWGYDPYGNRLIQAGSSAAFAVASPTPSGSSPCQPASGASYDSFWAQQSASNNNQLAGTTQAPGGVSQDGSGEVQADGRNDYLYDGDGRICAVKDLSTGAMTGYIYNADGRRVAKGTITAWSCNPSANGFATTNDYVLGPGGEQVTEMSVSGSTITWAHTNVWADGMLIATYDQTGKGLHFYQDDPLGTRRSQADPNGVQEQTCASLPYGDGETCSSAPTEHLFTGKERDSESGNDYFGARYYASSMGRFMSPDWSAKVEPVPYAKLDNPQSLNLYSYVQNNPLGGTDPDGHCCFAQDVASWITNGIATEGPKQFAEDVGIGALKGIGQTAYAVAAAGANQYNPAGFAASMLNQPSAITPANTTEAQAAFATSVIASAAVPAAGLEIAGADATAEIPEVAAEDFGIKGAQAPDQVTPGIANVKGVYDGEHGSQPYSAHYDQFGRQTGRTDYTSAPDATNHPNPHYHTREYGPGYGPKGKENGPIPGEHPQDQQ